MCKADMTPIPFFWSDQANEPFPEFRVEHTCRDFSKLSRWASNRVANVGKENEDAAARKFNTEIRKDPPKTVVSMGS
jgi:hypothetical protein